MSAQQEHESVLAATLAYHRRGWRVTPVRLGEKRPVGSGWQDLRLDEDGIRKAFATACNVGVLLGDASGGLVDVDLDVSEAAVVAGRLLPATARFGRAGKPGSHYLYRVTGEVKTRKFTAPDRTVLLELRSSGAQTVFPPSVHVSGEPIEWEDEREPLEIEAQELEQLVALVAAATLLARAWPAAGSRHEASLALAGGLLRLS